jgi:hypothetical protein
VGDSGGVRLVSIYRNQVDRGAMERQIQLSPARLAEAGFDHYRCFKAGRRRHQPFVVDFHGSIEPFGLWLIGQHRDERAGLDHPRAGNPRSS